MNGIAEVFVMTMKQVGGLFSFFIYLLGLLVFGIMMYRLFLFAWNAGLKRRVRRLMRKNHRLTEWAGGRK